MRSSPAVPASEAQWKTLRAQMRQALQQATFASWPAEAGPLEFNQAFAVEREGLQLAAYDFQSQPGIPLRLYLVRRAGADKSDLVVLNVLDEKQWRDFLATMRVGFAKELKGEALPEPDEKSFAAEQRMHKSFKWAMAYLAPRGDGPTAWSQGERKQTHIRRRFMLLGQTLDGMRVWEFFSFIPKLHDCC